VDSRDSGLLLFGVPPAMRVRSGNRPGVVEW